MAVIKAEDKSLIKGDMALGVVCGVLVVILTLGGLFLRYFPLIRGVGYSIIYSFIPVIMFFIALGVDAYLVIDTKNNREVAWGRFWIGFFIPGMVIFVLFFIPLFYFGVR